MKGIAGCIAASVALVAMLSTAGCWQPSSQEEPAVETQDAVVAQSEPIAGVSLGDFSVATLSGGTFGSDDFSGHDVTVINCWQTTCPPCIEEMPQIAEVASRLPDNVAVVTLCFDGQRKADLAQEILDKAGWTGETLVEVTGGLRSFCDAYIRYTPSTLFVTRDGIVVGDVLVGSPQNLQDTYLERINEALAAQGKPDVSLQDAE